jgi:hypothetical protein
MVALVLDRKVERRAGWPALLCGREEGGAVDGVSHPVAEAQVVDDRRAVLDLSVDPDERALG